MVRKIEEKDVLKIATLAYKVYTNSSIEELYNEFLEKVSFNNGLIICLEIDNNIVGFLESSKRFDYVEGTFSSPVGYLEGIFIEEMYRGKGYAKELVDYAVSWAKAEGCMEFASDCPLDNELSIEVHKHLGFIEVNRIVCFKKEI